MNFLLIPNGQYSSPLEGSVRLLTGEPARLMSGAAVETLYTPRLSSRTIGTKSTPLDRGEFNGAVSLNPDPRANPLPLRGVPQRGEGCDGSVSWNIENRNHTLRITPVAMPPSREENTRLSIKKEASLMSESRLKKSVFDTLTAQILKTIKMVMVIGLLSLTPDLSQGLRKGIHRIETVLTVLLCGQNLTHLKTTTPASLRHPLLCKEGTIVVIACPTYARRGS